MSVIVNQQVISTLGQQSLTQEAPAVSRNSSQRPIAELLSKVQRHCIVFPSDASYNAIKRDCLGAHCDTNTCIIIQPDNIDDVRATLRFSNDAQLPVGCRSNSSHYWMTSPFSEAVLIDFSKLRGVEVDANLKQVRIQPGTTLGDLDRATAACGLAVPVGTHSSVGVFGLVLGGGVGWLSRKCGASVDNILSVDIMLADGTIMTASRTQNQDLFWAVRGAASNMGIVTSITMRAHEITKCYRGTMCYTVDQVSEVLKAVNEFQRTAVNEFNCEIETITLNGSTLWQVSYSFYHTEGETLAAPLKAIGTPVQSEWNWISHLENQQSHEIKSWTQESHTTKTGTLKFSDLTPTFIDALVACSSTSKTGSTIRMLGLGGAMKDHGPSSTSFFPIRQQDWLITFWESSPVNDTTHGQWCEQAFATLNLSKYNAGYGNMMTVDADAVNDDKLHRAFGVNLPRLRTLKAKYDPENFFRCNLNITPA